jgi:hypothetical protein
MPNFFYEDMFFDPATYSSCRDIFHDRQFMNAIKVIQPSDDVANRKRWPNMDWRSADAVQKRMARVLLRLRGWEYCDTSFLVEGTRYMHALFDPVDNSIRLYRTACTATRIYGVSIESLNAGHRFYLITGHEIGHVIDAEAGRLPQAVNLISDPNALQQAEMRANFLGAYLGQCASRQWQKLVLEVGPPETLAARRCLASRYQAFEKFFADFRSQSPDIRRAHLLNRTNVFGCFGESAPDAPPSGTLIPRESSNSPLLVQ